MGGEYEGFNLGRGRGGSCRGDILQKQHPNGGSKAGLPSAAAPASLAMRNV